MMWRWFVLCDDWCLSPNDKHFDGGVHEFSDAVSCHAMHAIPISSHAHQIIYIFTNTTLTCYGNYSLNAPLAFPSKEKEDKHGKKQFEKGFPRKTIHYIAFQREDDIYTPRKYYIPGIE